MSRKCIVFLTFLLAALSVILYLATVPIADASPREAIEILPDGGMCAPDFDCRRFAAATCGAHTNVWSVAASAQHNPDGSWQRSCLIRCGSLLGNTSVETCTQLTRPNPVGTPDCDICPGEICSFRCQACEVTQQACKDRDPVDCDGLLCCPDLDNCPF